MPVALPPLPYAYGALAPYMSSATLRFHHDGHQARYVRNTNQMVRGSPLENATLVEIIEAAEAGRGDGDRQGAPFLRRPAASWERLYQQASQAWTHAMFWHCMRPGGGAAPEGPLRPWWRDAREAFVAEAKALFGSGWVWLVNDDGQLRVVRTSNAERPPSGQPLLVCDLWEHAYYLDYPDAKGQFVDVWLDRLVNWGFAEQMLVGEIPPELQ